MRALPKIILGAAIPIIVGFLFTTYFSIYQQTIRTRDSLVAQYQNTADFLAKEVEVGYYESNWPFENLAELTKQPDFVFWWLVDDRGRVYLSNDSAFMGADAISYFPQIDRRPAREGLVAVGEGNSNVYYKNFEAGKKQWSFWIGFSMESLDLAVRRIVILNVLTALAVFLLIALAISIITRQAVKPLHELVNGTRKFAEGDLDYRIAAKGSGEFSYLGRAFNSMAEKLQGHYRELEDKVKERTAELEKTTAQLAIEKKNALDKAEELERMNAAMVGRELKMVELKEEVGKLKDRLKKQ